MRLNCFIVASAIWLRAHLRSGIAVRRSVGLGGLVPHFFHVHDRGRRLVVEDYIPRRRKAGPFDRGDSALAFDGLYRVRVYELIGTATSDTLFGAYRQALIMAAGRDRTIRV